MIGTTAALLGSAAIGAGGSILGGLFGSRAAKSAAEIQAEAAAKAGQQVVNATNAANPQIGEAASRAGDLLRSTAGDSSAQAEAAAAKANALLNPFAKAGTNAVDTLDAGLAAGGDFNRTPTMDDIQIDPGFEFRLKEAQKAIDRSAAARGGALGGGVLKALTRYSQDAASQEYANAFDRYRANLNDRYSRLKGVSDSGQQAAGTMGGNLVDTAKFGGTLIASAAEKAGDWDTSAANRTAQNTIDASRAAGEFATGGANARAAGVVGGANAISNGISGAGGSVMNALLLSQLLKGSAPTPAAPAAPKAQPSWP